MNPPPIERRAGLLDRRLENAAIVLDRLDTLVESLNKIQLNMEAFDKRVTAIETAQAIAVALSLQRGRMFSWLPESITTLLAVMLGAGINYFLIR